MMTTNETTFNFSSRTAIVTGAASGIGREIAQQLGASHANLVIADRAESRQQVAEDIRNHGGQAIDINVNVANQQSVEAMIATTERHFGRVDILIHCAGIGVEKPFIRNHHRRVE